MNNGFIGGLQTPVFTIYGWKKISDIIPGDSVLTHKKCFSMVKELIVSPKKTKEATYIYFKETISLGSNNTRKKITVSEDKLVMMEDFSLKMACDLKENDSVLLLGEVCSGCGVVCKYFLKYCTPNCFGGKPIKNIQDKYDFVGVKVDKIEKVIFKKKIYFYNLHLMDENTFISKGIVFHQ